MEVEIDVDRLHADLLEHFGTSQFWCTKHAPNRSWGPTYSQESLLPIPPVNHGMDRANGFAGDFIHNKYTDTEGYIPHDTGVPIAAGALGSIDTMYETGDYQGLADLAEQEGFDLTEYMI